MLIKYAIVLFIFIAKSSSKIQINVHTAAVKTKAEVTHSGTDNKLVTVKEVKLFNITQENLKIGIKKELGRRPDDVFLKDPTPYDNLYAKFKWMQVNRNARVKSAEVVKIVTENVTLERHTVINNTTDRIKYRVGLTAIVENIATSTWSDGWPDDDIFYNINMTFVKNNVQYEKKWRDRDYSAVVNFGLPNIGDMFLESGQEVTLELTGTKAILLVKIDYSFKLIGRVITDYARKYGKHHFYAPSVGDIMKAANLTNEKITTELLEIRCYVNPHLNVVNKNTSVPAPVIIPNGPFIAKKAYIHL